jgi:hypothetical protein
VKYCLFTILFAGLAWPQAHITELVPDLNGRRVADASAYVAKDGDRTDLTQSINGRRVPLQQSETRVLKDGPGGRTTETVVRKYDATGQLASTERTVVETAKRPNGATVLATVYRSDVNGRMQESERRSIETQADGPTAHTAVTVSRPGLSGSFEVAEKRNVVSMADGKTLHETEVIERPLQAGQFVEVGREVRDQAAVGNKTTSTITNYEPDFTGKMSLIRQQVANITKAPDGTLVTEVDLFAPSAYGIARDERAAPKLKEQELIVRKEKNGVVTETTTVSRPLLADPNHLGAAQPVSELVCTGKCDGPLQP